MRAPEVSTTTWSSYDPDVLLTLLAAIALDNHEPATLAVLLTAPGALLGRIIAFYFPRPRGAGENKKAAQWRLMGVLILAGPMGSDPRPPA